MYTFQLIQWAYRRIVPRHWPNEAYTADLFYLYLQSTILYTTHTTLIKFEQTEIQKFGTGTKIFLQIFRIFKLRRVEQ